MVVCLFYSLLCLRRVTHSTCREREVKVVKKGM